MQNNGTSLVDLYTRFGATIFKGQLIDAQDKLANQESRSGSELLVTDLVSEDKYVADRIKYEEIADEKYEINNVNQNIGNSSKVKKTKYKDIMLHPAYSIIK